MAALKEMIRFIILLIDRSDFIYFRRKIYFKVRTNLNESSDK